MSDESRRTFRSGCADEVCVSYSLPLRPALVAASLAVAALAPAAAAAQAASAEIEAEEMEIIVGGISDPASADYIVVDTGKSLSDLPVVYEEDGQAEASPGSKLKLAAAGDGRGRTSVISRHWSKPASWLAAATERESPSPIVIAM